MALVEKPPYRPHSPFTHTGSTESNQLNVNVFWLWEETVYPEKTLQPHPEGSGHPEPGDSTTGAHPRCSSMLKHWLFLTYKFKILMCALRHEMSLIINFMCFYFVFFHFLSFTNSLLLFLNAWLKPCKMDINLNTKKEPICAVKHQKNYYRSEQPVWFFSRVAI